MRRGTVGTINSWEFTSYKGDRIAKCDAGRRVLCDIRLRSAGTRDASFAGMTLPSYPQYGQDLRDRTFQFACRIVRFSDSLWKAGGVARILAPQLLRCGTSVGANLEEARGGQSRRDFLSKCAIALKEARESQYRLRLAIETRMGPSEEARALAVEADELAAILGAIVRNTRKTLTD